MAKEWRDESKDDQFAGFEKFFNSRPNIYYTAFNPEQKKLFDLLGKNNDQIRLNSVLDNAFGIYLISQYKKKYSGKIRVSFRVKNKHLAHQKKLCENCPLANKCKDNQPFLSITDIQSLINTIQSTACIQIDNYLP